MADQWVASRPGTGYGSPVSGRSRAGVMPRRMDGEGGDMSILMEMAMFPTDKGESVGAEVSRVIAMIRDSGITYQLTPMGTIVETDTLDQALDLIRRAHDILEPSSNRIYATVKFDIRKGSTGRMAGKIRSVEKRIGEVRTSRVPGPGAFPADDRG